MLNRIHATTHHATFDFSNLNQQQPVNPALQRLPPITSLNLPAHRHDNNAQVSTSNPPISEFKDHEHSGEVFSLHSNCVLQHQSIPETTAIEILAEKRRRNANVSARFRDRKKQEHRNLIEKCINYEKRIKELEEKIHEKERETQMDKLFRRGAETPT
ncbi:uncharacterized protein VTP21DRAFT_8014 [Calcarisporiella thermophila]|uniref:uncharacterized protein n=1 Tax=Calcarisporiella thermophila TaxID=911321 RepID=UPI00374486A8